MEEREGRREVCVSDGDALVEILSVSGKGQRREGGSGGKEGRGGWGGERWREVEGKNRGI